MIKKKLGWVYAGYRLRSVDVIRYGFNSFFENEIHDDNEEQDGDDQCENCPVFFSHTCSFK